MSANDGDAPKAALPAELWEKVASMRDVYWKVTTVETVLCLEMYMDVHTATPHCTVVRYLREVPTDDDTAGYHKRVRTHLDDGEFALYGAAHPKLAPTHRTYRPGQPPVQVGDPLWSMYSVFFTHNRRFNEHGDFDDQSVATTTLVGAERVGGGSLKRRRDEPDAGP